LPRSDRCFSAGNLSTACIKKWFTPRMWFLFNDKICWWHRNG
jgi:hypothetical protein